MSTQLAQAAGALLGNARIPAVSFDQMVAATTVNILLSAIPILISPSMCSASARATGHLVLILTALYPAEPYRISLLRLWFQGVAQHLAPPQHQLEGSGQSAHFTPRV